ncbi:MAG: hypothetical protein ACXAEN_24650 [Candidatus Thorarchaeota archaeon]|jgi:hypothetical protein
MANENARRDANRVTTALGVTNDASQETRNLLIDPATGALLVTLGGGGGGLLTGAESGLYVSGSNVRLGVNPLLEDVSINGNLLYSMDFTNLVDFTADIQNNFYMSRANNTDFFNAVNGFLGTDSVGYSHTDGTEIMASYIQTGVSANIVYTDTSTNVVNQLKVNTGVASLSATAPTIANTVTARQTDAELSAATGSDKTSFRVEATTSYMNEGTTDDGGDGTAVNGYVAKLVDKTTGEWNWGTAAVSEICDTDGDTCVEVERTADDDTIRMKAAGVDVGTMTSAAYDFTIGEYATKRGTFLGQPGVGFEFIDSVTPAQTGYIALNEVGGQPFLGSRLTNGTGDVVNTNHSPFSWSARATNGAENSSVSVSKDQLLLTHDNQNFVSITDALMNIDVASGDLYVNEGTTASGTAAATNGMVFTLINNTNGEAKWAAAPVTGNSTDALTVGGGVWVQFNHALGTTNVNVDTVRSDTKQSVIIGWRIDDANNIAFRKNGANLDLDVVVVAVA